MSGFVQIQDYPPPTELPAMRAGEIDGRYMDCGPALLPVGDFIPSISNVTVTVTRRDGNTLTSADLQPAGAAWQPTLSANGLIVTWGWYAPPTSAGVAYLLTLEANPTQEGRTFIRDWLMSVLPLLG